MAGRSSFGWDRCAVNQAFRKQLLTQFIVPLALVILLFGLAAWWPLEGLASSWLARQGSSPTESAAIVQDPRPLADGMLNVQ